MKWMIKLRPWVIEVVGRRLNGSRGRLGLIFIGDGPRGRVVAELEEPLKTQKKHFKITGRFLAFKKKEI